MTTFATSAAVGEREQLADVIYRIDPAETPIFPNVTKDTAHALFLELHVNELAHARPSTYHKDRAYTYTAPATPHPPPTN